MTTDDIDAAVEQAAAAYEVADAEWKAAQAAYSLAQERYEVAFRTRNELYIPWRNALVERNRQRGI